MVSNKSLLTSMNITPRMFSSSGNLNHRWTMRKHSILDHFTLIKIWSVERTSRISLKNLVTNLKILITIWRDGMLLMANMNAQRTNKIFQLLRFLLMRLLYSARLKESVFLMSTNGSMLLKETTTELSHGVKISMGQQTLPEFQRHALGMSAKVLTCSNQKRLEHTAQLAMPYLA